MRGKEFSDAYRRIINGLVTLRANDAVANLFGAIGHRYKLHPLLAERELTDFESNHRVQLPPDYSGFLLHVGNGGAGPAYGIFKLGEMDNAFGHRRWKEDDGRARVITTPARTSYLITKVPNPRLPRYEE